MINNCYSIYDYITIFCVSKLRKNKFKYFIYTLHVEFDKSSIRLQSMEKVKVKLFMVVIHPKRFQS